VTFVTSTISFGGYTFPAGFHVLDLGNDTVIDEVKVPFIDGTSAPPGSRNSKVIHLQGTIGGWGAVDSSGNYITTSDQAEAEYQTMVSYLESGYQQLTLGQTPARYILAQKRKLLKTPVPGTGRRALDIEIEFLAQDPRWLSTTIHTATGSTFGGNNFVQNSGTAISYPKFTITGACTNPGFQIQGTPGQYVSIATTFTMNAGDQLVFDCDPRNRPNAILYTPNGGSATPRLDILGTNGITNTFGNSAMMPYMLPNTLMNLTPTVGSGTPSWTLSWQDAWL
jgi:hypothetical protein